MSFSECSKKELPMKILLTTLNSQYVHSNPALRYLYTVVANEKSDVSLREFTINNDLKYIYTEVIRANYDLVCFSCYLWNIEQIKELSSDLKKAEPEIKIMLGGPEVSFMIPEFMKRNPWCDYIVSGEGEYAFYRFVRAMDGVRTEGCLTLSDELSTIPGLSYRDNGKIFINGESKPMNFNAIPFPYSILEPEQDKVVYYESSRGCPYNCSYCLSSVDKELRTLDTTRVYREITYFLFKRVMQVKFIDRTFNFSANRAKNILSHIIESDNGFTNFQFEICGELIDDEMLRILKKARKGLFRFEIGIQSLNPRTLEAVNRHYDETRLFNNIKELIALGNCHVHTDLIAGLPYESLESFGLGFNKAYGLKSDMLQLGFLKVLKGTPMYENCERYGIVYREKAPYEVISTDYLSAEELVHIRMIENMLDIYYNRGGFTNTLEYMIESFSSEHGLSAFDFYSRLADFYYEGGYQHRDRRKDDQYRIMLKFAKKLEREVGPADLSNWAEYMLTKDLEANFDELNYRRFISKGWDI